MTLHFLKLSNPHFIKTSINTSYEDSELGRREPMLAINDASGYSTVFLPGDAPAIIIKPASSPPQLINTLDRSMKCMTRLRRSTSEFGFAYLDQKVRHENTTVFN